MDVVLITFTDTAAIVVIFAATPITRGMQRDLCAGVCWV